MKNQKGLAAIIILIIVIIAIGGGILAYRYWQAPKEKTKAPAASEEILPKEEVQPEETQPEEEKKVKAPTHYTIKDPIDVKESTLYDVTHIDVTECRIFITDQEYKFETELVGDVDTEKGDYIIWIDSDNNASTGFIGQGGAEYKIHVFYGSPFGIESAISEHIGSGVFKKVRDIEYNAGGNTLTMTADLTSLDMCNANLWVQTLGRYANSDKTDSVFITSGCL